MINIFDEKPYTDEQLLNAEQEMRKLVFDSSRKYKQPANVMFTKLSEVTQAISKNLRWGHTNPLWSLQFGLACCAIELMDFGAARIDAERKGFLMFRGNPRQCDVMVTAGWVTKSMAPTVKRLYEQMLNPKYVISYGECATSGGPWYESYNIIKGIDQILPVDVYVVGCPPKPENLFSAFIKLQEKISGKSVGDTERSISAGMRGDEEKRL